MKQKSKSLYNITAEQQEIIQFLHENEGELTPEIEERLKITEKDRNQKSIAYLEVLSDKKARVSMAKERMNYLKSLIKAEEKVIERLESNLLNAVKTFGTYEVGLIKFGTRKSTQVEVLSGMVNQLPKEYKTVKVTEQPNKIAIKKALIDGEDIDGCKLIYNVNLKIN